MENNYCNICGNKQREVDRYLLDSLNALKSQLADENTSKLGKYKNIDKINILSRCISVLENVRGLTYVRTDM